MRTHPGRPSLRRVRRTTSRAIILVAGLLLAGSLPAAVQQGFLENPLDFGYESGVSVVSGFHCNATLIEIQFDQYDPIAAAHGTSRNDTLDYCGRSDTGFSLLWNWAILGPGTHTVRAFADGVEFDSATIEVRTLGAEFVTGVVARAGADLLAIGKEVGLRWAESKQGFVIDEVHDLDYTIDDVVAAISGDWTGFWHSPQGAGSIEMTIGAAPGGFPGLTALTFGSTGCAPGGVALNDLVDLGDPLIVVQLDDGSRVSFEFMTTESFTMLGGTFWFEDGHCADLDGMFYMFR